MRHLPEIEEEIAAILREPLPDFPGRYIPREALHALMTEKLTLEGFANGNERLIDLEARRFAIEHVPQNLFSYPMSKRETRIMAVDPGFLKEYASRPTQPPTSPEQQEKQMKSLLARWGKDTS